MGRLMPEQSSPHAGVPRDNPEKILESSYAVSAREAPAADLLEANGSSFAGSLRRSARPARGRLRTSAIFVGQSRTRKNSEDRRRLHPGFDVLV